MQGSCADSQKREVGGLIDGGLMPEALMASDFKLRLEIERLKA